MDELKQRFDEGIRSLPFAPPKELRRRGRHRAHAQLASAAAALVAVSAIALGVADARGTSANVPATNRSAAPAVFDCQPVSAVQAHTVTPIDPFPAAVGLSAADLGAGWVPMAGGLPEPGATRTTGVFTGPMPLLDDSYLPAWVGGSLGPKGWDPTATRLFLPGEVHATASRYAFYASTARAQDLVRSVVIDYAAGDGQRVLAQLRQAVSCGVPGWRDYQILVDTTSSGRELLVLANPRSSSPLLKMAVGRVGDHVTVVQYIPARSAVDTKRIQHLGERAIERLAAALAHSAGR